MKTSMSQSSITAHPESVTLPQAEIDGHEERFREFVDRSSDRAMRVAWRWVEGDTSAAEDIVQEAFIAAWKALPHFRGESSLDTWFFRILIRRAQNHRRWKNIRTLWSGTAESDHADPNAIPDGDPFLQARIKRALGQLSRRQREAFLLVHMDGFTVREAAAILGLRSGSIKSHLHRALCHLRVELRDLMESQGSSLPGESGESNGTE